MTWMQFIVGMTEALAWPIASFLVLLTVVSRLEDLRRAIASLKFRDVELSFRDKIEDIKKEAEAASITTTRPISVINADLLAEARENPSLLILEGHRLIDEQFVLLMRAKGERMSNLNIQNLKRALSKHILPEDLGALIKQAVTLRNNVAHAQNITLTRNEAIDYYLLAKSVSERLDQLRR